MKTSCAAVLALAALAVATASRAQSSTPAPPPLLTASAQLTLDEIADVSGGVARGERFLDKLEGAVELDGSSVGRSWLAGRFDVGLMNGQKVSSGLTGDIQGVNNIEAVKAFRIYNAWLGFTGDRGGAEIGVIDLNSQFDVHDVATVFLNSSYGIGPELSHSGLSGPSIYPNSALGVVAWTDDSDKDLRVRAGAFDGVPNDPNKPQRTSVSLSPGQGALLIAEADATWGRRNRFVAGAWGYTSALPRLTQPSRTGHGSAGVYATLEATLVERDDGRRLDGWVRAGWSDATFNIVAQYAGGGLVYKGVFAGPKVDALGVAVAYANLSPGVPILTGAVPGAGVVGSGTETTVEVTYQRRLHDWLTIQPDAQYVFTPAGRSDVPDAVVIGVRLILSAG